MWRAKEASGADVRRGLFSLGFGSSVDFFAMKILEETIDIAVPVNTAYNQWTQFEQFPQFMESVKQVVQLDERRVYFHAALPGYDQEWDAEIFEQVPDHVIAWHSVHGPK